MRPAAAMPLLQKDSDLLTKMASTYVNYWERHMRTNLLKICSLMLFTCCLPFMYANSMMDYPCKEKLLLVNGTITREAAMACDAQDFLRSYWSFAFVPAAGFVGGSVLALGSLVDIMTASSLGFKIGQSMRDMGKKYAAMLVDGYIENVKYMAPVAYNIVTLSYVSIVVEMLGISAMFMSPVALLLGIAISRAFLYCANALLSPSGPLIAKMEGVLASWPQSNGASTPITGMFCRLKAQKYGRTIYTTMEELDAIGTLLALQELADMNTLRSMQRNSVLKHFKEVLIPAGMPIVPTVGWDGRTGWWIGNIPLSGGWNQYPARYVYIVEGSSGKISKMVDAHKEEVVYDEGD